MKSLAKFILIPGLASVAAYAWVTTTGTNPPPAISAAAAFPEQTLRVLTLREQTAAGTPFDDLSLSSIDIQLDQVAESYLVDTASTAKTYSGRKLTKEVFPGAILQSSDFEIIPSKSTAIRASLGESMRAIAISVSPESAAAGLIFPGDRIDVISTRKIAEDGLESSILIRGSKVLAIDQVVAPEANSSPLPPATTLTLEVSEEGATAIALARELGSLSVVISTAEEMSEVLPSDGALRTTEMFFQARSPDAEPPEDDHSTIIVRRGTTVETSRVLKQE